MMVVGTANKELGPARRAVGVRLLFCPDALFARPRETSGKFPRRSYTTPPHACLKFEKRVLLVLSACCACVTTASMIGQSGVVCIRLSVCWALLFPAPLAATSVESPMAGKPHGTHT